MEGNREGHTCRKMGIHLNIEGRGENDSGETGKITTSNVENWIVNVAAKCLLSACFKPLQSSYALCIPQNTLLGRIMADEK